MKFKSLLTLCLAGASITAVAQGYKDGIEYYKADQFKNAKELLIRNINNADTDKAASYYYLGCIAMKEGNNTEALELFNKGIESNANYAYNYVGLGAIDLANNLPKAAEKQFKAAEKLAKKDLSVYVAVARAYYNSDPVAYSAEIEKKLDKVRKSSDNFAPKDADFYMLIGDMAADQSDWGKAASQYEMATTYEPSATEAYVKGASMYLKLNPTYAINMLKKLLALNPTSALGQRELADKYYDTKNYKEAVVEYAKYVKNPNHFKQDEDRYAFLLFFSGDYKAGYDFATKLLAENSANFTAQRYQFMNAAQLPEMKDQLLPMAEALVANHNETNRFAAIDYTLIADEFKNAKQYDKAIAVLEEGIKEMPENASFYKSLAMLYVEQNQIAKAADTYKGYIANLSNPGFNDKSQYATFCYYGAIEAKATDADRSNALFDEATAIAQELAEKYPTVPRGYKMLGDIKVQRANEAEVAVIAFDEYKKACDIIVNEGNAAQFASDAKVVFNYLGNYYLEQNDVETAKSYFYKYLEIDPNNDAYRSFVEGLK
ncbi:MAG: tetratricopeptide repeat protein [Bacteroidales bacterium]|nr:tetratricopeptide repeat protein [Bacteroidales bacterium]